MDSSDPACTQQTVEEPPALWLDYVAGHQCPADRVSTLYASPLQQLCALLVFGIKFKQQLDCSYSATLHTLLQHGARKGLCATMHTGSHRNRRRWCEKTACKPEQPKDPCDTSAIQYPSTHGRETASLQLSRPGPC